MTLKKCTVTKVKTVFFTHFHEKLMFQRYMFFLLDSKKVLYLLKGYYFGLYYILQVFILIYSPQYFYYI